MRLVLLSSCFTGLVRDQIRLILQSTGLTGQVMESTDALGDFKKNPEKPQISWVLACTTDWEAGERSDASRRGQIGPSYRVCDQARQPVHRTSKSMRSWRGLSRLAVDYLRSGYWAGSAGEGL